MTAVVEVAGLSKHYGGERGSRVHAVTDAGFALEENRIHGLLGRNGAGKTTLMQLLTGQEFASSGEIRVFGQNPVENAKVLDRVCFIKESQRYPDDFRVKHVLATAPRFFADWDEDFADELVERFRVPVGRRMKKLSRGQLSAVGVIVGLASRAPLTFFDEPYLGLDAVARRLFYDTLLADFAEHPRTVVLSTHLIDEVSNLLEHVLVIDEGRIIIDADADELRGSAVDVVGPRGAVEAFTSDREVLHRTGLGGLASATVAGLDEAGRTAARDAGLELAAVSLQQLVIRTTIGESVDPTKGTPE
ncbi:ABC transporter ATP-binding protein [Protaetiibacter mangrovi]|uniref:ABC transporter ATP-binding protein n=1 Tax=Protaetiibacter mangrovi TaxID=2970926 RepID=A0ABT1ZIX8_9MICO|nr:ABC transporter ATP-binding protein [Protaetiibacter mangrovi]MCS0500659.1 ABC transporter ATP-binding protein [Protaetiibacter mangrovi]TPX05038.1 ABC transporter ATP-binding protein [Schumannella luteola]